MLRVGKLTDRTALEVLARGQAEHPRLRALAQNGSLNSRHFDQDIYGCHAVKDALWELQSSRCCFCEREYESAHSTVEHFRPKSSAKRAEKTFDPGYWWLAYDPDNLLFACAVCNNLKRDWFPLESGSRSLKAGERTHQGKERPALLDPRRDDPEEHLTYVWWDMIQGYAIAAKSERGSRTIEILGLDREALFWLRRRYFHFYLDPLIKRVPHRQRKATRLPPNLAALAGPDAQLGFFTRCVLLHQGFNLVAIERVARR